MRPRIMSKPRQVPIVVGCVVIGSEAVIIAVAIVAVVGNALGAVGRVVGVEQAASVRV